MLKDEQSLKDLKEYIFIIFRMNYYFDTQDESIIKLTKYRSFCVITHNNKSFRRFKMNRRLLKESISSGVITGFYKAS
jgi:ribosomal protein S14